MEFTPELALAAIVVGTGAGGAVLARVFEPRLRRRAWRRSYDRGQRKTRRRAKRSV